MPPLRSGPLEGVLVVDLSRQLAGPTVTRILAELGARVVRIEQQGSTGDLYISVGGGPQATNKECIVLDLKSVDGRRMLESLLSKADVMVENFRPGTLAEMGYGWERVRRLWPRLILCSVSGFGQTGPKSSFPAMDIVAQAMSGLMASTGFEDRTPACVGSFVGDFTAGLYGAIGILGALHGRRATGRGTHVDVSLLDSLAVLMESKSQNVLNGGSPAPRAGDSPAPGIFPFGTFKCKDGELALIGIQNAFWDSICEVLELPECRSDFVSADRRAAGKTTGLYRGAGLRYVHRDKLRPMIETKLLTDTVESWYERFRSAGVPCGPVHTLESAVKEPQLLARGMVQTIGGKGVLAGRKMIGTPIHYSESLWPRPERWQASKDEHGHALRAEFEAPSRL